MFALITKASPLVKSKILKIFVNCPNIIFKYKLFIIKCNFLIKKMVLTLKNKNLRRNHPSLK